MLIRDRCIQQYVSGSKGAFQILLFRKGKMKLCIVCNMGWIPCYLYHRIAGKSLCFHVFNRRQIFHLDHAHAGGNRMGVRSCAQKIRLI